MLTANATHLEYAGNREIDLAYGMMDSFGTFSIFWGRDTIYCVPTFGAPQVTEKILRLFCMINRVDRLRQRLVAVVSARLRWRGQVNGKYLQ